MPGSSPSYALLSLLAYLSLLFSAGRMSFFLSHLPDMKRNKNALLLLLLLLLAAAATFLDGCRYARRLKLLASLSHTDNR